MLKRKLSYIFWAMLYAFGIYNLTGLIFNFAYPSTALAIILNMSLIFLFVIAEKIELHIAKKICPKAATNIGPFKKAFLYYVKGPSFKSAMYVFYLAILIYSALEAADPARFNFFPEAYLQSVRYGIWVLVAADNFLVQIIADVYADRDTLGEG